MANPIDEMEGRIQELRDSVDPGQVAPLMPLESAIFMLRVFQVGTAFLAHSDELLRLARIGAKTEGN